PRGGVASRLEADDGLGDALGARRPSGAGARFGGVDGDGAIAGCAGVAWGSDGDSFEGAGVLDGLALEGGWFAGPEDAHGDAAGAAAAAPTAAPRAASPAAASKAAVG